MATSTYPDDVVVVRGGGASGKQNIQQMKDSVARTKAILAAEGKTQESILSVFTGIDLTGDEICARGSRILQRWSQYRETTVGELRTLGHAISRPGRDGHAKLKLPAQPSDNDYARIDAAFGPAKSNPAAEKKE